MIPSTNPHSLRSFGTLISASFLLLVTLCTPVVHARGDLWLAPPPPPPPPTAPVLYLYSEGVQTDEVAIGRDLDLWLRNGDPSTTYSLRLLDDNNQLILTAFAVTNAYGDAHVEDFWIETGVLGCEPWSNPDPNLYLFHDMLEAETHLDGRTFQVQVAASPQGPALTVEAFGLYAETGVTVPYLSDAAACRRHVFYAHDSLHTSFAHPAIGIAPVRIFVVPYQSGWQVGDPLVDQTDDGSDLAYLFGTNVVQTVDLGQVFATGFFTVIVRYDNDPSPLMGPGDLVTEPRVSLMDSKTFQPCSGIHCPPPSPGP